MSLLIIKNNSHEGPELIAEVLKKHSVTFDLVDLDAGETFPDPLSYDGLIVMGGPDSANDDSDKMRTEVAQVATALKAGQPFLGVCLGLQVGVKAVGGTVIKSPVRETGTRHDDNQIYTVTKTSEGKTDELLKGLPDTFPVFQLHGETVELLPTMHIIAEGPYCRPQFVKIQNKAYGMQCHLDLTDESFDDWTKHFPDFQTVDLDELRRDWHSLKSDYAAACHQIVTNFLRLSGLI